MRVGLRQRCDGFGLTSVAAGAKSATIVSMTIEPLRDVRDHFSDVIDRVERSTIYRTLRRTRPPVTDPHRPFANNLG